MSSAKLIKQSVLQTDSAFEYARNGSVEPLLEILKGIIVEDLEDFIDQIHTKTRFTLLSVAAYEGQLDTVILLIDNDCKIDCLNGMKHSALMESCFSGFPGMI